jgi:hypothetical protein
MWGIICILIVLWVLTSSGKQTYQKPNNNNNNNDDSFDDFIMYDIVSDGDLDGNFSDEY